jgi:hypothetical protein
MVRAQAQKRRGHPLILEAENLVVQHS